MNRRIAIVHDWLIQSGGAEEVLVALHSLFPQAPIYTAIYDPNCLPDRLKNAHIIPSFLQKFPLSRQFYRYYLPLMPLAFEQFDLSSYELVISSSHACAKGVVTGPDTYHIAYIHTPMRYAWDLYHDYFGAESNLLKKALLSLLFHYLRGWDQINTLRIDKLVCNSKYVQKRIWKDYHREAEVIYPPVDTAYFMGTSFQERSDFFLIVSRLVAYKRIDLAITAFNQLSLSLLIVGEGSERQRLQKIAGKSIQFLGYQDRNSLANLYRTASALIFPGLEDFGIVPIEAQAAGCPVIAYGHGGAMESVLDGETGLFFSEQTEQALIHAIQQFQGKRFKTQQLQRHAAQFERSVFEASFKQLIQAL